jgi:hypothetical protein
MKQQQQQRAQAMAKKKKETKSYHVICVYASQERMHEVGFKLISLVKSQRIGYKLDEATSQGMYAHNGHRNICLEALYWTSDILALPN